jgi:hypothetical protein
VVHETIVFRLDKVFVLSQNHTILSSDVALSFCQGMYMCLFTDTTTCINNQSEEDIITVSFEPRFLTSVDVLMPEVDSEDACIEQGYPNSCALACGKVMVNADVSICRF